MLSKMPSIEIPFLQTHQESLQKLLKEVNGIKYSVQASSILDVENITDDFVTVTIKNSKVSSIYFQLYFYENYVRICSIPIEFVVKVIALFLFYFSL